MKDLLDEAVSALRDEGAADDGAHRFTRARVMASLHQGTVKRRTRLAFLLPIAATFVATSAWGVSTGRARVWIEEIRTVLGFTPPSEAPTEPPKASAPKRTQRPTAFATPKPPAEAPVPATPEVALEPAKPVVERTRPPASAAPDAGVDAELELYRAAHRAHFTERNSQAALRAWDAYLAKAPKGRFVLEARYNRALCLVRLERKAEARAALEPFARGAYGAYRKREASELLDALGD